MARCMAQTVSSDRPTPIKPMLALSVACSRLPRNAFHNQCAISRQLYLLSGNLNMLFIFTNNYYVLFKFHCLPSAPHIIFSRKVEKKLADARFTTRAT